MVCCSKCSKVTKCFTKIFKKKRVKHLHRFQSKTPYWELDLVPLAWTRFEKKIFENQRDIFCGKSSINATEIYHKFYLKLAKSCT